MLSALMRKHIELALKEDIGASDVTTASLVSSSQKIQADIWLKESGVVCGLWVLKEIFQRLSRQITFRPLVKEGAWINKTQIIAHLYGPAAPILTGERVALNYLSMMSAVATQTANYVRAVHPYNTAIVDTRKTMPLLRPFQRYAVNCGGGVNHRYNLNDAAMIKDNHRFLNQGLSLEKMVNTIKKKSPSKKVILEIDDPKQAKEALLTRADIILLDNMTPKQIAQIVRMNREKQQSKILEASGGIQLKTVKAYAKTGVDRISIGALTHHIASMDVSLDVKFLA